MEQKTVLAVCGSVTYAMKAKSVLGYRGISAYVMKAPTGLYSCGCNSSVKFKCPRPELAIDLLRAASVKLGAVYVEEDGGWREIWKKEGR